MSLKLHIVSLDIPFPADYGGVIDIYYKLKALHAAGAKITLHCSYKDRKPAAELEQLCEGVHYYKRSQSPSVSLPYIVSSRSDKKLLENLCRDDAPILFEGLHTTYFAEHKQLQGRKIFIRLHNIEQRYYAGLAKAEKNLLKRIYFREESRRLKIYENKLFNNRDLHFLPLSRQDEFFLNTYKANATFLRSFTPAKEINIQTGKGNYLLYHGNLSVAENLHVALHIISELADKIKIPVIISGKNPANDLQEKASKCSNVRIVANPTEKEMQELIADAQIHYVPSENDTGIKLKLLVSLFNGRHIITNAKAIHADDALKVLVHTCDEISQTIETINGLATQVFTEMQIIKRKEILAGAYNNDLNAQTLLRLASKH